MGSKQTVLTQLKEELDAWDKLLALLSETQIETARPTGLMTIKDTVAHLKSWGEISIARFEAAASGTAPSYTGWPADLDPDDDDATDPLNAWILTTHQGRPWRDIHREWRDGYSRLMALGETFSEEALRETGKYTWMEAGSLMAILEECFEHHHDEHRPPIEAWLRDNGIA